jgi:hypothetical protein
VTDRTRAEIPAGVGVGRTRDDHVAGLGDRLAQQRLRGGAGLDRAWNVDHDGGGAGARKPIDQSPEGGVVGERPLRFVGDDQHPVARRRRAAPARVDRLVEPSDAARRERENRGDGADRGSLKRAAEVGHRDGV